MAELHPEMHERRILGTELLWAFGVGVLIAATFSMIVFTALTRDINPPSNVERIDPKTLHLSGEFAEQNLGTTVGDGRQRHGACHRDPIHVRSALHRGAAGAARHAAFHDAGRHSRHADHRYERQYDGGAGLRLAGTHRVHPHRRSPDAMPRVLRPGPQRDVGDRPGAAGRANSSRRRTGGFPVRNVNRLCLAHFWVAFAAFRCRGCYRNVADVGAQPAGRACRHAGSIFHVGHRPRRSRWPMY